MAKLIFYLLVITLRTQIPTEYALEYTIQVKDRGPSFTQFIVNQENVITSIQFDKTDMSWVSSFVFSHVDSLVTIKTINHKKKEFFFNQISYQKYLETDCSYDLKIAETEKNVIQVFKENNEFDFTAYLNTSYPNIYPKTIMNKNIRYLPERLVYQNRTCQLDRVIEENEEIKNILSHTKTIGYKSNNVIDLKRKMEAISGYSFEEMKERLRQKQ